MSAKKILASVITAATLSATVVPAAQAQSSSSSAPSGPAGWTVKSDVVAEAVNALLPDVLNEMEPHWQEFDSSRSDDFGAFLSTRSKDVTDSILNVADRKTDEVNNNTLTKTYKSMRSKAAKILEPKVPELANILQRHM
ncbi:MAG: hypothetical protein SPJ78_05405 [Corynebacterium camporealensis]|uniref:DUF6918 family protein n=1 Tax=Corynebacterium camporealensis TaxID=161896 RepID=UPI002A91FDE6|nr:hypothetical protein [Corynebacterium camporealensis]MDY5840139.1 hypothetical protein [Corynebacterium camporealensis]